MEYTEEQVYFAGEPRLNFWDVTQTEEESNRRLELYFKTYVEKEIKLEMQKQGEL